MALSHEELREAASHRGLRLVKSRKRKPGVGDYGFFGLTDAAGKPLFGIGDDGLTASADQIADFLRKGEASTWAASAKATPARPRQSAARARRSSDDENAPSAIRPRRRAMRKPVGTNDSPADPHSVKSGPKSQSVRQKSEVHASQSGEAAPRPASARELSIRSARPADAEALLRLLSSIGFGGGTAELRRAIAAATARKEPIFVADRGAVVGCLSWHVIPTVQQRSIGRITALIVEEDERRHGIGRALYQAVLIAFQKRDVHSIEATSPIEINNANAFYRAIGLKQDNYCFSVDL
jgi:N-acetylglutamate synthase-like GNAT family acetyltransferase